MSTRSGDLSSGRDESQSELDTACEITSADTRGGGGGSKDRVTDIMAEISSGYTGTTIGKDRYDIDTRGGGKGSKD